MNELNLIESGMAARSEKIRVLESEAARLLAARTKTPKKHIKGVIEIWETISVETHDQDFDGFTKLLKKAVSWKRQMVKRGLVSARAKCPTCGQTEMKITCNIGGNENLHCHCRNCGAGFIE